MPSNEPVIAITSGEPAGIGPDLCAILSQKDYNQRIVVIGCPDLIASRAETLGIDIKEIIIAEKDNSNVVYQECGKIYVSPVNLNNKVICGKLDSNNSNYVLEILTKAATGCLNNQYAAMVTGPIHKGVINESGLEFTGHTEFLADLTNTKLPVMMLATPGLRVALATTHLPIAKVSKAITKELLEKIISITNTDTKKIFNIDSPKILVCGLNPHAGENGYLGSEEIKTITPAIESMKQKGINIEGPFPADTVFTKSYIENSDVILAMYHDQGLPVLKHLGFGNAVNITLGLPIIRTSVDHGTALDLAGTGKANFGSMEYALQIAISAINGK